MKLGIFRSWRRAAALLVTPGLIVATANAQLNEDFETVTETGGGAILDGSGFNELIGWDDGIMGEGSFAGTVGSAIQILAEAFGDADGGVGGSGGGVLSISDIAFNLFDFNFNNVTGTGGGVFLVGDGNPDTFNFTPNWDDGIEGEGAFGGTANGATLVGSMSAEGLLMGGPDSSGSARLDVDDVTVGGGLWFAGLQFDTGPLPGAPVLRNPGFDDGGANLNDWEIFSAGFNVVPETFPVNSAPGSCKMFGQFSGVANESGILQRLPAQPGQVWEIDCLSQHITGDAIAGTSNFMLMRIEFIDVSNNMLLVVDQMILDSSSPIDTWIDNAALQATAPANTVEVRAVFTFTQPANEGGAGYIDDCRMRLVSGPSPINLADFNLMADVRGTADSAGEVLGDIQIRIEDADGDRLRFISTANGNWQSIGGTLDTAEEADASGMPASGVFDINSAFYRVVIALDNESGSTWGSGGTLDVDNVAVLNSGSGGGGAWFAGLFWRGLSLPALMLDELELSADIMGSVPGGEYELRVEAFEEFDAGLDDDFNGATGTGGGLFFDQASIMGGATSNFIPSFDDGTTGGAFGGIFGNAEFFSGGGITAVGLMTGGPDNSGIAEIRVENVIFGPGGGWFAGLTWPDQGLASSDLSQVTLSADIRGMTASGGSLGMYELRIEDEQGDRLFFEVQADGNWQSVGGTLDTATEGGAAGGGGDGTFNLDSPAYAVTVSFVAAEIDWQFGGVLQVDNIFLTPVTVRNEIGRVSFCGVSDGINFQSVGGLLTEGTSTLGDNLEDFSSATGTGGGDAGTGGYDDGIQNEESFFGTFGDATVNGGATAEACLTCGVGGSEAAVMTVTDVAPNTGGWFVGIFQRPVPTDFSGGLASVTMTADIKGEANGAGSMLGEYFFRLEDSDGDVLVFNTMADGTFQSVGGTLDTAMQDQIPGQGDGNFDLNQTNYTVTIGAVGTSAVWGSGMTLTVDNVFLTGISLSAIDSVTVVAAYKNEAGSWPNGGDLVVDNIVFDVASGGLPGDMNCDGVVTVSDIGGFVLALTNPAQYMLDFPDCDVNNADVSGDGSVTVSDIGPFVALLTGG